MARSTWVAHAFEWEKLLKCHLKGKASKKLANGQNIDYSEKRKRPKGFICPCTGVKYHNIQTCLLVYAADSGERLQDHWSSGFLKSNVIITSSTPPAQNGDVSRHCPTSSLNLAHKTTPGPPTYIHFLIPLGFSFSFLQKNKFRKITPNSSLFVRRVTYLFSIIILHAHPQYVFF